MPPLRILKKRTRQGVESLNKEKDRLDREVKDSRERLRASVSFNAQFWTTAHEVEKLVLEVLVSREISLADFGGHPARWQQTDEARIVFSHVRAQEHRVASFKAQAKILGNPRQKIHEAFMNLLTTSPIGLNMKSGSAPRDKSGQSQFQGQLIKDQKALYSNGRLLWCPVLHEWLPKELMKAGHLFPCVHGQQGSAKVLERDSH